MRGSADDTTGASRHTSAGVLALDHAVSRRRSLSRRHVLRFDAGGVERMCKSRRRWVAPLVALGTLLAVLATMPAPKAAPRDEALLPASTFPAVHALLDAGRAADALVALGTEVPPEADRLEHALLKARAAERVALDRRATPALAQPVPDQSASGSRSAESEPLMAAALASWNDVATREPALRPLARRRGVDLALRAGHLQTAGDAARTALATSTAEGRALALRVAAAFDAADQSETAISLYELVLQQQVDGADADRARLGLARALERRGRAEEALAVWREAQRRMRGTETFRLARAGERALSQTLGRALAPFSEADYDALSRRLVAASRFEDALELIIEWQRFAPQSTDRYRIEARRITALYNLRRNEEARRAAAAFEAGDGPLALEADMAVMQFRLAVRDGRVAEAGERGLAIWKGTVGGVQPDDRRSVASLLANYWLSLGQVSDALELYRELYTTAPTMADKRSYLLRLCVAAIRAGQHTRAVTNLRALLRLGPQGDAQVAAEFWLGVALEGAGERDAGLLALADVEDAYRHSYYGLRATARLDELAARGVATATAVRRAREARARQPLFPDLVLSSAATSARELALGTSLLRAGLREDGAQQYRSLASRLTRDDALALLAARASDVATDHRAAVGLVMSHFGDTITHGAANEPADLRSLAYPRPFWPEIQAAATRASVDPRILVSLMRRESRFDPRARSAVGALGLFQIMPYTAAALAPTLGVSATTDDEMLEPRVNAAIAAALVGRLSSLFGTALPPLVASYNAGEDRVGDWWRASAALPPDLFVEIIPYAETRGFVREVLTNHDAYGRLYR